MVTGDYLPIQIIQSKKLSVADNLWLRSLTDDLESGEAGVIVEEGSKRILYSGAYLNVLIRANSEAFLEVQTMARPTFEEVFTKAGLIPQWIEQGIEQGLKQGITQGIERGRVQGFEQGSRQSRLEIARRMKTLGFSAEQTIAATGLSPEDIADL
jgi:flagellar biosynthesis/type III secretory pathway protein FliH